MSKNKKLLALGALSVFALTGCAQATESGQTAVVADGNFIVPVDPELIECMPPETSRITFADEVYRYPARQISWDAFGNEGSERSPYKVVSNRDAPAELTVPVVVTLDLTTDCDLLKEFHRELGTKYDAWMNDDGTSSEGWVQLLDYVVGQPTEVTLVRVAQKYPWQEIWNDEAVRLEFEKSLSENLPERIKERSGGKEFFTNIQVTVGKPDPIDAALKEAIASEQTGVAKANAAELSAAAEEKAAIAETKVANEKAKQKQAEINGYPSVDAYLKAKCIEDGCNPFQPSYVFPGGAPAEGK